MLKYLSGLFLLIFYLGHLEAQNAKALIKAEHSFEQSCLQLGIRDGFLAWVDPNGIEFTEKGPSNARERWSSYASFEGIFSWTPSYAEMSISGDWGYTTGNYLHRANSLKDSVDDAGQYTTVWHQNDKGEWKYLADIGNKHDPISPQKQAHTIWIGKFKATKFTDSTGLADLERTFIGAFEKNVQDAYRKFGSSRYLINVPKHLVVKGTDSALLLLQSYPSLPKYHVSGLFISPGGDMAAVYGSIGNTDHKGSYLRVWRFEKNGWKIAMEVIRD